jgi:hypothetical protein
MRRAAYSLYGVCVCVCVCVIAGVESEGCAAVLMTQHHTQKNNTPASWLSFDIVSEIDFAGSNRFSVSL